MNERRVTVAIEAMPRVSLALQQQGVPFLHEVRVRNEGTALDRVVVELRADPPFFAPVTWRCEALAEGEERLVRLDDVVLSPTFLGSQAERSEGFVEVVVRAAGEEVGVGRRQVEILAPTHWLGTGVLPELIAAFIRPNARALVPVLQAAAARLEVLGGGTALSGYQQRDPRQVARQVQAVWEAVQAVGLTYINPPASFEAIGQKVRTHEVVLGDRLGTCLDLAVLVAAALEQVGLHPLIVVVQGHAFVGAWLTDFELPEAVLDDPAPLRKRVEIGEAIVVDSSPLTGPTPFIEAARSAERMLADAGRFVLAVDVAAARHAASPVRPLPLGEGGAVDEVVRPTVTTGASTWDEDRFRPAAATTRGPVATRIERWQRRLLDLSLRNRLLNHKEGSKTLPVPRVDLAALEDALAQGRSFQLLPRSELRGLPPEATQADVEAARRAHADEALSKGRLLVDVPPAQLDKAALELDRLARSAMEETGATALYLGLGMLRWFESASSSEPRFAPLILVPVRLVRPASGGVWQVAGVEEETRVNVTLLQKLKADFGIDLAGLDQPPTDDAGLDVTAILQGFRRGIVDQKRWEVVEQATLTTFSFAKFLMWLDLAAKGDQILASPVVKQIVEGTVAPVASGRPLLAEADVATARAPSELFGVVDADPTQLRAILAAEDGHSFVLQGPPGTGKSQTITNLIAQLVANGKTVLFVSEKLAALEVVHTRLQRAGLGPFCLELHSDKATRAGVVEQLKAPFEIKAAGSAAGWAQHSSALLAARAPVDAHVERLRRPTPFGVPLRDVVTELVGLADAPKLDLGITPADVSVVRRLEEVSARVARAADEVAPASAHPWRDVGISAWTPRVEAAAVDGLGRLDAALVRWEGALSAARDALRLPAADGWAAGAEVATLAAAVLDAPDDLPRALTEPAGADARRTALTAWLDRASAARGRREALMAAWRPELFGLDLVGLHARYEKWAGAFFLFAFFALWSARSALGAVRQGALPAATVVRDELGEARALTGELGTVLSADAAITQALGAAWRGADTDTEKVKGWLRAADALIAARLAVAARLGDLTATARAASLATDERPLLMPGGALHTALSGVVAAKADVDAAHAALVTLLKLPTGGLLRGDVASARARIAAMQADPASLRVWTALVEVAAEAEAAGLKPLATEVLDGRIAGPQIVRTLRRSLLEPWWWAQLEADPELARFRGAQHAQTVQRFKELDAASTALARAEVVRRAAEAVPDLHAPGEEMGLLRRQLQLQKRHLPPRKLFAQLPNVLRRIKPVLMMSPASVARFLDPSLPGYDVVVFDEASQIPPWDAIGAIARGRQAVIVGDSKQLPPTSFFDRAEGETDEVLDDEAVEEVDSILEEAAASSLHQLPLRWHYRSRHESLIAFSNRHYYDNRLHTFPSADASSNGVGLELRPLPPGSYDRGGSRTNRAEAEALVTELEALLSRPDGERPSVGVVTFSMAQQRLVQDLTDTLRQRRPDLDRHFVDGPNEHVFIKNLENVQGDERDVMLFSIGYGADPTGKVTMSFGPLNRSGGERRLNVAITRARERLIVFSSLDPDQIDLNRTSAVGARHLRAFLRFAKQGAKALDAEALAEGVTRFESPFEQQVYDALVAAGHTVHTQIGCSGYRVDLGVVDPARPGRYLLGIECDGATYHGSRSARERDRLRQAVLEGLGWRMARVWSTDWWHDRKGQTGRLLEEVERARRAAPVVAPAPVKPPPVAAIASASVAEQLAAPAVVTLPAQASGWTPLPTVAGGPSDLFYEASSGSALAAQLQQVVRTSGPVSAEAAFKQVATAWGFARMGARIVATLEAALLRLPASERPRRVGDFLWPVGMDPAKWTGFRPDAAGRRAPDEVPPEELRNAAGWARARGVGLSDDEVVTEVCKAFGWSRSKGAVAAIGAALARR